MVASSELPLALSITFAPESSTISLTLFNQPEPSVKAIPLELKFKYDPSTPYAPIHEIVDDRNLRIKQVRCLLTCVDERERADFGSWATALLGSVGARSFRDPRHVPAQDFGRV
jgi:enoyl reductase-like protein